MTALFSRSFFSFRDSRVPGAKSHTLTAQAYAARLRSIPLLLRSDAVVSWCEVFAVLVLVFALVSGLWCFITAVASLP
jgi:hypothetical protein